MDTEKAVIPEDDDEEPKEAVSQPHSAKSRLPSRSGVRASFSRPVTAAPEEAADTEEVEDVLITQLDDLEYNRQPEGFETSEAVLDTSQELTEESDIIVPSKPKTPDIFCAEDWDTDLESEDEEEEDDPTFRKLYLDICHSLGVAPTSYFVRHIEDEAVIMKHHGLRVTETQALSKALQSILSIKSLDLEGNNMCERGCQYLCRMLEDNSIILELNLSENQLGNAGATYVAKMLLINSSLTKLRLAGNCMNDNVASLFVECLEESKVRLLDLSRNDFGVKSGLLLGAAIGANEYLEEIDLSWNKIRRQGALAIARGLKENVRLKVCYLAWNGFGEEGGLAIADALMTNNSLKELDISSNRLTVAVATKLSKALLTNDSLEVLRMADNPISTTGCISIITAVNNSQSSELCVLDLQKIAVEFEFLKTAEELRRKRVIEITHGAVLRAGNTTEDIGKPAVDIKDQKPVLLMKEHLIINDKRRLRALLSNTEGDNSCTPGELIRCLQKLDSTLDSNSLVTAVEKIPTTDGRIIYGEILR